jgi:tetratricopeptide (TPR) repeat protein
MAIFSTFNPSAMPPDVIEATFVQRQSIAERLVEIFEESARRKSKHNVLLVGPRGIGKSHLVSLVYHRLKAKPALADKLCIAYLKEDEWGMNTFLDLLLRILRAVSDEENLATPTNISDLSQVSRTEAENHAWQSLQRILKDRTLLLIIENLDAVFERIEEQGQKQWRALMQTNPQWAILGTTPALFSGVSRQVSPFYGFFEVIHLKPLSFDEAIGLLQRLAHWNKDEATANFLGTAVGRARVRAVQHLAGGNHRIFVLFYDFLNQTRSESLVVPLIKTIDALTPYYQSQMSILSPQQQKIVNFLCEHRNPATVTVIAKSCLTTHQTAAGQLKQLLTRRYVRVDRVGRESFYELTEPLLRICVEAKTHRERPLDLLVDFIRYWFSREELQEKLSHATERELEKTYFLAALKEYDDRNAHVHLTPAIATLCKALTLEKGTPQQLQAEAEELAQVSKIAEDWGHYTRAMIWLGREPEAVPILEEVLEKNPNDADFLRALAGLYARSGSAIQAQELLNRAIELNPSDGFLFFDKAGLLAQANQNDEALAAFEEAARLSPVMKADVAVQRARVLQKMNRFEAARKGLYPFLPKGKMIPGLFSYYAVSLADENKFLEALEFFDKAIRAFEYDPHAWGNRGITLYKLERYKEALDSLDRATTLDPEPNKTLLHFRCLTLLAMGQYKTAAESAIPEDLAHCIFHGLLDILNAHPKQGKLQQELATLMTADSSPAWQDAFFGGLTELASLFKEATSLEDLENLKAWNLALKELFSGQERFAILLKFFDVLARVKILDDRKALLELPREQRLLVIGEKKEEDFLNRTDDRA